MLIESQRLHDAGVMLIMTVT